MKRICDKCDLKKHKKAVWGLYLTCYAIDLLLGFFLIKKIMSKQDKDA